MYRRFLFGIYGYFSYLCIMMRLGSKKILSMLSVSVATFILLVFAIVPHHHHGGVVCMVIEQCEQNATSNEHRGHNGCDDVNHNNLCLTETEYVTSSNDDTACKVSSCDSHDHTHINHILPLLCVIVDAFVGISDISIKEYAYSEFVPACQSLYVGLANGLRAPPFSIC